MGHSHEHHSHSDENMDHATHARPLLEEGCGRGKILFLDALSGISGDMTVSALLDLGIPVSVIERTLSVLPIQGYHLHRGYVHRNGIGASSFEVHIEAEQPVRHFAEIDQMLKQVELPKGVSEMSRSIFRTLALAESRVHRVDVSHVHFHEVGAVDAIVDIVAVSTLITYLGADVVAAPLPMGHGVVQTAHGILPLPAPAVVECLQHVPTYGVDIAAELVTPTGAAIVATLAKQFERWPSIAPERVGYGAGKRELVERPNVLRVVLGKPTSVMAMGHLGTHCVVEANMDDITGELTAYVMEALLQDGALDVWVTPITMKKGRPAITLSVLTHAENLERISSILLRESTTIGVRSYPVSRVERPRHVQTISTVFGDVRVKVSEGLFGAPQLKPEYDDCVALAKANHVPLREVIASVMCMMRERK